MADRRRSLHEAAHKLDPERRSDAASNGAKPSGRRNLNMAAHKLGYWPTTPKGGVSTNGGAARLEADRERDIVVQGSKMLLALGALGVVFGDIGTSPLYTERVIFTLHGNAATTTVA